VHTGGADNIRAVYSGVDADAGRVRTERIGVAADLLYVEDRVNYGRSSHSSAWTSTLHGLEVVEPATLQWQALPSATDLTRCQIRALRVPLALDNYRFWMVVVDNTKDRPHRR
jgi:hypothetical protein